MKTNKKGNKSNEKEGRVVLECRKTLASGHDDFFIAIVSVDDKDNAKKKYESIGYIVTVK